MVQPDIKTSTGGGTPRVCYLFLAHQKFDLLLRIVERLAAPGVGFVFHIDRKVPASTIEDFKRRLTPKAQHVAYSRRERARWASYKQAKAIMRCIQSALTELPPFERYVLASGQCYPLMSPDEIAHFFADHPTTEFIEARPLDPSDAKAPGWSDYYRFRRIHIWYGDKWRPIPLLRRGTLALPLYHGSEWWALTRAAVEYVRHQFENNHKLRRQMSTSVFVDEAYIPTLMMASPMAANVANKSPTYADFSQTHRTGPHPTVLTSADLPAMMSSGKLLARKVDLATDAKLLDLVDEFVRDRQSGGAKRCNGAVSVVTA